MTVHLAATISEISQLVAPPAWGTMMVCDICWHVVGLSMQLWNWTVSSPGRSFQNCFAILVSNGPAQNMRHCETGIHGYVIWIHVIHVRHIYIRMHPKMDVALCWVQSVLTPLKRDGVQYISWLIVLFQSNRSAVDYGIRWDSWTQRFYGFSMVFLPQSWQQYEATDPRRDH